MKSLCQNGVTLTLVPSTALYQSSSAATMLFLRWNAENPPASLALEDVWAGSGLPSNPGYIIFVNVPPANPSAFEKDLRNLVLAPVATGFIWANYAAAGSSVLTLIISKPNASNIPCVAGNTQLKLLPGSQGVGFGDQSPVIAGYADDCISSFNFTYPPMVGSFPPRGSGVSLPMTGSFVGCVQFTALVNSFTPDASAVRKSVVLVSIDPLRPLDPTRNYQTFTGQDYLLAGEGGAYRLLPVA